MTRRHNVFVSYHHAKDQYYRDKFEHMFVRVHDIMVSKSVQIGDILDNKPTELIRQVIRNEYLKESTVTVVLIGEDTWKRKHVDWEISSSIRDTVNNPRSGLLGIILPTYPRNYQNKYSSYTIPPRLAQNIDCGFAKIYNWSSNPILVQEWIHEAFLSRNMVLPDNSYPMFIRNRSTDQKQWMI